MKFRNPRNLLKQRRNHAGISISDPGITVADQTPDLL
jgi:hypothetical protein